MGYLAERHADQPLQLFGGLRAGGVGIAHGLAADLAHDTVAVAQPDAEVVEVVLQARAYLSSGILYRRNYFHPAPEHAGHRGFLLLFSQVLVAKDCSIFEHYM
ncbi:hypothetical protein D9M72_527360 [compost metagenome]